eukprot:1146293-Pelagomonas_calceolata.AAC.4
MEVHMELLGKKAVQGVKVLLSGGSQGAASPALKIPVLNLGRISWRGCCQREFKEIAYTIYHSKTSINKGHSPYMRLKGVLQQLWGSLSSSNLSQVQIRKGNTMVERTD